MRAKEGQGGERVHKVDGVARMLGGGYSNKLEISFKHFKCFLNDFFYFILLFLLTTL